LKRAFEVFTEMETWWPETHHAGDAPLEKAVMECRTGGRCYSTQTNGTEFDWGTVVVWEPPRRLVFAWQVNMACEYEPDLSKASEVEVRFTPVRGGSTRVDLEHGCLQRHGEGFEEMRNEVDDKNGWAALLQSYRARAEQAGMRRFDQTFGIFLLIGAAGHTAGTLLLLTALSDIWIWSLGAALAAFLLGALNLLRAARPHDRTLALIATIGTALWASLAMVFGITIGNIWDPRVMTHFVASVVLVGFGLNTLWRLRTSVIKPAPRASSTVSA
jgi:uncharacterized protein YndB with AHSA1/START domain